MSVMLCCPACRAWMTVSEALGGQSVTCPSCGLLVTAPAAAEAPVPVPPPDPPPQEDIRLEVVPPGEEGFEVLQEDSSATEPESGYAEAPRPARKPKRDRMETPRSNASPRLRAAVAAELQRGEEIIWCGQPAHEQALLRALLVLIPGGILVLAALVWLFAGLLKMGSNRSSSLDVCFPLVLMAAGAGCGVLGFHWLWTPFHTCYTLTNRRALVWRRSWLGSMALEEYLPNDLGAMTCREGPGGRGDLIFRTVRETYSYTQGKEVRTAVRTSEFGFKDLPHVRAVGQMVRHTLRLPAR